MTFFKSLENIVAADLIVKFEVRSAGNGKLQLYLSTSPKSGEAKLVIPPVALKATPEELDAQVPEFMQTYAAGSLNLVDQFKQTEQAIATANAAEKQRRDSEVAARAAKNPSKGPTSPARSSSSGATKARDASDGLIDLGGGDGGGGDCDTETSVSGSEATAFLV